MHEPKGRLLIIDDDEGILFTLRILLRKQFVEVVTCQSPQQITHLLSQQYYDVVLLDMNFSLGNTSGEEGLSWLKEVKKKSPDSQVVMMTAYADIDLAIKAIKQGAHDFVIKPWDNHKMVETVLQARSQSMLDRKATLEAYELEFSSMARETCRIFMFLDIRSSTRIAEQLGHLSYFNLLNDFFADVSEPIVAHQGEIYQYVGDEVVVSWGLEEGILDQQCLPCFFAITERMNARAPYYMKNYGLIPDFKAGMHFGKVSVGSVGTVKKEQVYTGDVLHTASRLEGLCNRYHTQLLISQDLLDRIPDSPSFQSRSLGTIQLRGKLDPVTLCAIDRVG
ncbi:MAG: response regulator [Bacteroidota bacterium]